MTNEGEVSIGRSTATVATSIIENHETGTGTSFDCGAYIDSCDASELIASWQSFTLEENETVEYLELYLTDVSFGSGETTTDITVYQGQGTGGTVVGQVTDVTISGFSSPTWVTIDVPDFVASSGTYTIHASIATSWFYSTSDTYSGGRTSFSANRDFNFRVYGQTYNDNYVKVTSSGWEVGDYVLPYEDGTSGQILSTDGSGAISWADVAAIADTDDQTLSLSGTDPNHCRR